MFTQLLASRPVRQRAAGGLAASVVFHSSLAAFAVLGTVGTAKTVRQAVEQKVIYVDQAVEPPKPVDQPPEPVVPPSGPPIVSIPTVIPTHLPPLPTTVEPISEPLLRVTRFIPGAAPSTGASDPPSTGAVHLAEQVEVEVAIARGSPLPAYPTALRSTSIAGEARFRFVVDSAGRVEMATVEQVSASHMAFSQAVRSTLPRMRFTPASVGGRTVRQLVELPFVFRVTR